MKDETHNVLVCPYRFEIQNLSVLIIGGGDPDPGVKRSHNVHICYQYDMGLSLCLTVDFCNGRTM